MEEEAKEEAKVVACRICGRTFKNRSGRWKHEGHRHGRVSLKEYNCGWADCDHTSYGVARQCRWRRRQLPKGNKRRVKDAEEGHEDEGKGNI